MLDNRGYQKQEVTLVVRKDVRSLRRVGSVQKKNYTRGKQKIGGAIGNKNFGVLEDLPSMNVRHVQHL